MEDWDTLNTKYVLKMNINNDRNIFLEDSYVLSIFSQF